MQVYCYDNPVTALLEFEPNFYDLLLIDVNMPMMDGFQLAQKLLQKDLIGLDKNIAIRPRKRYLNRKLHSWLQDNLSMKKP